MSLLLRSYICCCQASRAGSSKSLAHALRVLEAVHRRAHRRGGDRGDDDGDGGRGRRRAARPPASTRRRRSRRRGGRGGDEHRGRAITALGAAWRSQGARPGRAPHPPGSDALGRVEGSPPAWVTYSVQPAASLAAEARTRSLGVAWFGPSLPGGRAMKRSIRRRAARKQSNTFCYVHVDSSSAQIVV